MYKISDTQLDYILDDISARGVGMVSLQHDLLDHVCCVIEQELDEDGDFERFYQSVITRFYKRELHEIEAETIHLLTHKNYYVMKKIMLASGAASTGLLLIGIILKFMHWPGAAVTLVLGVAVLSLVFLPLLYTLKAREQQQKSDRIIAGIGTLAGILISLGILFKVMHWPGANIMCSIALLITLFIFLPVYFFAGVRNPQTKVNTIVSSVLLFAGCALILILVRAPGGTKNDCVNYTDYFLRNERIVQSEARLLAQTGQKQTLGTDGVAISRLCGDLKSFLVQSETGLSNLDDNFEQKGAWISEKHANVYFSEAPEQRSKLAMLKQSLARYNSAHESQRGFEPIKVGAKSLDPNDRVRNILNDLSQIQLMVLQNHRLLATP